MVYIAKGIIYNGKVFSRVELAGPFAGQEEAEQFLRSEGYFYLKESTRDCEKGWYRNDKENPRGLSGATLHFLQVEAVIRT